MIRIIKQQLNEMARVGTFNNYDIRIYPENLGLATFHLSKGTEWEIVLAIKDFTIIEIKQNSKKEKFVKKGSISISLQKQLVEFFKNTNSLGTTNWSFLLYTWNMNNPKYLISSTLSLPEVKIKE